MQITMQRARSPWPAKKKKLSMTLDCSRIAKEIAIKVEFLSRAGGRHFFILTRDKNKKDQKNLRRKLVDYCRNRAITSNEP